MRVIRINTTAWSDEDFFLVTTLDDGLQRVYIEEINL